MKVATYATVALVALVTAAGCGRDQTGSDPTPTSRSASEPMPGSGEAGPAAAEGEGRPIVEVSEARPTHLVDAAGLALYVLEGNADGSRCDAECENAWPPVQAEESQPLAGPGGFEARLETIPRDDGGLHVAFDGQPLYRYVADTGVGTTAGHGVEDNWGRWSLVNPDGSPATD